MIRNERQTMDTITDVRFEITALPEPDDMFSTHHLAMYAIPTGELLESHILGDPYDFVQGFREAQAAMELSHEDRNQMELERELRAEGVIR